MDDQLIVITPCVGHETGWFTVERRDNTAYGIEIRARNITTEQYTRVYIDNDTARALIDALQRAIETEANS